ncbi:hypothetical protein [Methylobacterium ajmalii]|uniref:hypothetical protein n=1 Tax=Methylobacterium ajmalii TaxID=2738439 RepID=UPI00190CC5AB|nr:hypothetical protein [Methylobacterium ajmalii]MBK3397767.1 hypothetical protein [Methylobacterium ajmalii]MBK3408462.1 hypothetical protein [Methylobacterium ajmalii]MBK3424137.1 hypothetical protein [Methylobacterium ajmalii]MBZ6416614.1 hypothetical protein [Methylobacterium sp.]
MALEIPIPEEDLEEARPRACVVSTEEVVALVRDGVREAGSQAEFARRHRLNEGDLSSTLSGARRPTAPVMAAVGARRAIVIEERACG